MAVLPPDPVFSIRSADMGPIHSLCFHQCERLFAGTETGAVHLWDLQTNRSPLQFQAGTNPVISMGNNDNVFFTQEKGGTIKIWSLSNCGYDLQSQIQTNHLAFCRGELMIDRNMIVCPTGNSEVILSSVDKGEGILKLTPEGTTQLGTVTCLRTVIMGGQTYILTGYESGDILTWDLRVCKPINQTHLIEDCPLSIDYDPYTNRGVCAGPSSNIAVFEYEKPLIHMGKKSDIAIKNPGINCVKIRYDQKVFVSAGWDGRIRIFSWKSLRPLAVLTEHKNGGVMDIAFSTKKVCMWNAPIMAAAGMDSQISLWDLYN